MLQILYFVSLSYLLITTHIVRCEDDYSRINNKANGWLKLHRTPQTWEQAFVRCHDEGAVLASPLNTELANALFSEMAKYGVNGPIFLGTHDYFAKGLFTSLEGVPLSDMDIKWGARSKSADDGDCLTMSVDRIVSYSSCKDPLPFICYKTMNRCGTFDRKYRLSQLTGSCYKIHPDKQSWTRAYSICEGEGGHLVILNDAEEARIVKDMFRDRTGDGFHIGLVAWGKERIWTTIHGEIIEDVYNKWAPGEPNNDKGVQDRALYKWDGNLDDVSKDASLHIFACEKSPKSKQHQECHHTV